MEKSQKPSAEAKNSARTGGKKIKAKTISPYLIVKEAPSHKIDEIIPLMECYNG